MKIKKIKNMDCYNAKDAASYLEMPRTTFQYYVYGDKTYNPIQFTVFRGRRWFPIEYLDKWNEQDSNVLYAYKRKRKKEPKNSNILDFKKAEKAENAN
jgi:hypothetical protein